MKRRTRKSAWAKSLERSLVALTRGAVKSGARALGQAMKPALARRASPAGEGSWILGIATGMAGARRFRLYRPPVVAAGERLPLMVMLHGCGQDANTFARSTRMNRVALRNRFLVLYPEQDRLANAQGCWNWFDSTAGRAGGEAALIMKMIDQVCLLHSADPTRVAIAGLSAGASMAALLVTRHPARFRAVVMHSGVPPGTAHSTLSALGAMHGHRTTKPLEATPLEVESGWPPLLVIHGDADKVVAQQNAHAAAQQWAEGLGARARPPRSVQRGQRHAMTVTDFRRAGRLVSRLVLVRGLAHAWSGGAAQLPFSDPLGPDASRMAWAFAAAQFRG
jgi:poly(hydroxyalkanoate) depolymerase family esterase